MFVDRVQIELHAGKGGDGCSSFRREKYIPHGGPDGGDGGDGGSIIMVVEQGVNNLASVAHKKIWRGERGEHGRGANCYGKSAHDTIIPVPPGTLVIDAEHNFVIKDLTQLGERFIAAKGGRGGRGNVHFKTSTNRAPRECEPGEEGENRKVILELKVIADVGLVGKPNAGKSTLLSRLTRARPEIADYPFTTKHPNLGLVQVGVDRSFVMADIPGLIEGAHVGVGLGHEFLRHIERAGILVHLVEPIPFDGTDPLANYRSIRSELEQYDVNLGARPEIIAVTKAELPGAAEFRDLLTNELHRPVLLISAVTGLGLNELTQTISRAGGTQRRRMTSTLLAIDIGNTAIKAGCFTAPDATTGLAAPALEPARWTQEVSLESLNFSLLAARLEPGCRWFVSSVNRPAETKLADWVRLHRLTDSYRLLNFRDVPLSLEIDFPERVGFDRLATAVAAHQLRKANTPVIVIDIGTALKVHAVSAAGAFLGGTISPGLKLSARALASETDLLPLVPTTTNDEPPPVLGKNTEAAIRSGLYWGVVGAVRETITRMRRELDGEPELFVTGGDARGVAKELGPAATYRADLCIAGIVRIASTL